MMKPMTISRVAAAVGMLTAYTIALIFLARLFATEEITAEKWLQIVSLWLLGVASVSAICLALMLAQRRELLNKAKCVEDYRANWRRTVEGKVD